MRARWLMTRARDGDMRSGAAGVGERRARVLDLSWTTTRQVHGAAVATIDTIEGVMDLDADAIVTRSSDVPVAMLAADCALIAFSSPEGPLGVAHAGWRGLVEGVIDATVAALRDLGANEISAACSPMIHPECYEFSKDDLDSVAARLGSGIVSLTSSGMPALDLPAGIDAALRRAGVLDISRLGGCTACEGEWFSWRARREEERHALVCWRPEDA
jgi:YfiH family protein